MMLSITDTNVFSRVFAGEKDIRAFVEASSTSVDAAIYIECLQGSKSAAEKRKIKNYLRNFPLILITPESSELAITLIERYSNSHGLMLPDALIAASAMDRGLHLYTHNISDFRFIDGLKCSEPPV